MPELLKRPRYKVGDLLQLNWRGPRWVGTVTEARGTYSPAGHVLYHVRVPMDPEPLFLLVREDEIADPLVLTRFAEEFRRLMDTPIAQERFRSRYASSIFVNATILKRILPNGPAGSKPIHLPVNDACREIRWLAVPAARHGTLRRRSIRPRSQTEWPHVDGIRPS